MRIDKWLWSMRLYKTRSIAAEATKNNRITVNGSLVKPSREVKVGDTVTVKKMPVIYSYKIIDLPKSRQGAALVPNFMKDITPQSEKDKLIQQVSVYLKRDKGTGRPTKRERRDIDSLMDSTIYDIDDDFDFDIDTEREPATVASQQEEEDLDDIDFNF